MCLGSSGSRAGGRAAVFTWQNLQPRVQVSPISMTVAVPPPQHSATLGQWASAQTVWSCSPRSVSLTLPYRSPPGIPTRSQLGLRASIGSTGILGFEPLIFAVSYS